MILSIKHGNKNDDKELLTQERLWTSLCEVVFREMSGSYWKEEGGAIGSSASPSV